MVSYSPEKWAWILSGMKWKYLCYPFAPVCLVIQDRPTIVQQCCGREKSVFRFAVAMGSSSAGQGL